MSNFLKNESDTSKKLELAIEKKWRNKMIIETHLTNGNKDENRKSIFSSRRRSPHVCDSIRFSTSL